MTLKLTTLNHEVQPVWLPSASIAVCTKYRNVGKSPDAVCDAAIISFSERARQYQAQTLMEEDEEQDAQNHDQHDNWPVGRVALHADARELGVTRLHGQKSFELSFGCEARRTKQLAQSRLRPSETRPGAQHEVTVVPLLVTKLLLLLLLLHAAPLKQSPGKQGYVWMIESKMGKWCQHSEHEPVLVRSRSRSRSSCSRPALRRRNTSHHWGSRCTCRCSDTCPVANTRRT